MRFQRLLPVVGLGIFLYLVLRAGVRNILEAVSNVSFVYILISFLFLIPIIFLQIFKWNLILKLQGMNLDFLFLFKVQLISLFYGAITPGRLGSLMKINYLKKRVNKGLGVCISNVVVDRLIDLIVIFLFGFVGSLLLIRFVSSVFWQIFFSLVILIFLIVLFSDKRRCSFVLRFFYNLLVPKRYKKYIEDAFNSFYDDLPKLKSLIVPFLVSVILWVVIYTQAYIIAKGVFLDIGYFYFISLFPIATIFGLVPITVSGLGTREAVLISLFSFFSSSDLSVKIISMSVLWVFISNVVYVILGSIFAFENEIYKKR